MSAPFDEGRRSGAQLAVVVACTRPHLLAACLAPLRGAPVGLVEIAVAGDVAEVDRSTLPAGTVLLAEPDRHANVRRNRALAATSAPLVAFLDDDASPEPGWLDAALAVDPTGRVVVTGPERPAHPGTTAGLIHGAASSWIAEGTRAHVSTVDRQVSWHEVPFCNVVVPRFIIEAVGDPSVEVPWDLDDFEFFDRMRSFVTFRSDPALAVRHDRYPDSIPAFLRSRWGLRRRTGEKVVSHPRLYLRVPSAAVAAIAPTVLVTALVLAEERGDELLGAGIAAYLLALLATVPHVVRHFGAHHVGPYLATLVGLHLASVIAVQLGILHGLVRRGRGAQRRRSASAG